jgi:MFS superfamily sulfate permease-like transporter
VVVVVGVEQGVILAIILSLLDHVRRHYDPHTSVVVGDVDGEITTAPAAAGTPLEPGLVVYRFGVGVFYANASRFTKEVIALVDVPERPRWLVLLADAIDDIDYTGGETLAELADQLKQRNVVFAIAGARAATIQELELFGVTEKIGRDHLFGTLEEAIAAFRAARPSANS